MAKTGETNQVHLEAAAATTVGMVRDSNEDRYLLDLPNRLFVVADGMGGHAAGEVASQMAIDKIAAELAQPQSAAGEFPKEIVLQAINTVHRTIRAASQNDPKLQGMGTTIVIAWFPTSQNTLWLAHIGDSRCYLYRGEQLRQLTEDHTLLNQALKLKKNAFDLEFLPSKHLLSQALGASEFIAPGIQALEIHPGDRLLLCSDGLSDMLTEEDLRKILSTTADLGSLCERLVAEANERGGRDNSTVLLIKA